MIELLINIPSKQQGTDLICKGRNKRMVSQHEMWSHHTTNSNKRRHNFDLRMGVRKKGSK
jgi:hypothetical protein